MAENRIALLRETVGMKPVDVASRLGVTERRVVRWERGETTIPDEWKLALARLFGTTVTFLMGWPDDPADDNGDGEVAQGAEAA